MERAANRRFLLFLGKTGPWIILGAWLGSGFGVAAHAQGSPGAFSLQVPPDVRSEGMGRAWIPLSTTPYATWGNVGALAFSEGLQFVRTNSQLAEGLAPDVHFDFTALSMGYGLRIGGVPVNASVGASRANLDYGSIEVTTPGSPDPIGTFNPYESADAVVVALGVLDAIGAGVGFKRIHVNLAPPEFVGPGGGGSGSQTAVDYGLLVRSPYLTYGAEGDPDLSLRFEEGGYAALRLLGGLAWSNHGDPISLTSDPSGGDPLPELRRESLGLELGILSAREVIPADSRLLRWAFQDVRLLTVSAALGQEISLVEEYQVGHDGWEINLLGLVSYRRGSIDDPGGSIQDTTEGWGVSLFGYAGYDRAEIPQATGLPKVTKEAWWIRFPLTFP